MAPTYSPEALRILQMQEYVKAGYSPAAARMLVDRYNPPAQRRAAPQRRAPARRRQTVRTNRSGPLPTATSPDLTMPLELMQGDQIPVEVAPGDLDFSAGMGMVPATADPAVNFDDSTLAALVAGAASALAPYVGPAADGVAALPPGAGYSALPSGPTTALLPGSPALPPGTAGALPRGVAAGGRAIPMGPAGVSPSGHFEMGGAMPSPAAPRSFPTTGSFSPFAGARLPYNLPAVYQGGLPAAAAGGAPAVLPRNLPAMYQNGLPATTPSLLGRIISAAMRGAGWASIPYLAATNPVDEVAASMGLDPTLYNSMLGAGDYGLDEEYVGY